MEDLTQPVWYQNLDWSMIWACTFAIVCIILFQLTQTTDPEKAKTSLKGVGHFFMPTWKNIIFQILAGYLMLAIAPEIGVPIVKGVLSIFNIKMDVDSADKIAHTLAVLSGLSGGYVLAFIAKKIQKLK